MQKRDDNSLPLGICKRFVNFVLSILSHPMSHKSVQVPIEEGSSRNNGKSSIRPPRANGSSAASEIVVEFRHIGASENWKTRVDDFDSSIHVPKKDASSIQVEEKSDVKARDKDLQEQGQSQERNPVAHERKNVNTKVQKNGFRNNDSTNLLAEGTKVNKPNEETKKNPPRPPWPLLSVASNINEKAEEFIKSKKEAMGLDPKKD
ncbi:Uncharacterized protein Adt_16229 [Abeliophyllum distichum]|uniref:Uncharacterized protein n=1 Tax=Abeliophyllum distichum TaxID=126358 RepID=A0ABD1TD24_9LAMI